MAGAAERKIETMTSIIYNVARKWFVTEERKALNLKAEQLNHKKRKFWPKGKTDFRGLFCAKAEQLFYHQSDLLAEV